MPWLKFKRDFDFKHTPHRLTAYKAGGEYLVTSRAAEAALKAGAATEHHDPEEGRRNAKAKINKR